MVVQRLERRHIWVQLFSPPERLFTSTSTFSPTENVEVKLKISYWRQVTVVSEDKVEFSGAVVDVDKDAVTVLQVIKSKIKFKP